MENIAEKITQYVMSDRDLDYEVIRYGVDAILSTILCFSIALITCAILKDFLFGVLFILFLTPIKMQFISYHCKTMTKCIITYSTCTGICLLIQHTLLNLNSNHLIILLVLSILFLISMVKDELLESNKKKLIVIIYLIFASIFYVISQYLLSMILIAICFECALLIAHKITNA